MGKQSTLQTPENYLGSKSLGNISIYLFYSKEHTPSESRNLLYLKEISRKIIMSCIFDTEPPVLISTKKI